MSDDYQDLIITAASESYRPQLLAFLGSLRCNWPSHPQVRVYDMGLRQGTDQFLRDAGFEVRLIPPFAPHWRKHYAWKPWCMNDASAERVLWLDAGCCVLRPLPEIFDIIGEQGYFALPNYRPLEIEASEEACEGCRVESGFRVGKVSLTAAVFGFRRGSMAQRVVAESSTIAHTERYIKASKPWHRWEQAILSLLMYRDISPLILCDGTIYFYEDLSPEFSMHAIWAARRSMHYKDKAFFSSCVTGPARPHLPRSSHKQALWYQAARQPKVALRAIMKMFRRQHTIIDGVK